MMMVVPLEPVVTMIPFRQVTQITDLHYSSAFLIAVFLHPWSLFYAKLRIFAFITIQTYEKKYPDTPVLYDNYDVSHNTDIICTDRPIQIYIRYGFSDATQHDRSGFQAPL